MNRVIADPMYPAHTYLRIGDLDEVAESVRAQDRAALVRVYPARNTATTIAHRIAGMTKKCRTRDGRRLKAVSRTFTNPDGEQVAGVFVYLTRKQHDGLVEFRDYIGGSRA